MQKQDMHGMRVANNRAVAWSSPCNQFTSKKNTPDEHRSIGPGPVVTAIVDKPHAMRVLFLLGVHGGDLKLFEEHASTYKRPTSNSPDEHRSIGPCPIVTAIVFCK